jgi:hypothetical protein
MSQAVSADVIKEKIFLIRGRKVMIDHDLAKLYGVPTKRLNEQVKRNIRRFPEDFLFELTDEEMRNLRSQFATSSWGGQRYRTNAFTEQGIAMLSSVLKSDRAIQVNIAIMRAFVQIREILLTHKELAAKIEALELKYKNHDIIELSFSDSKSSHSRLDGMERFGVLFTKRKLNKLSEYDAHIAAIFEAIRQLMAPPPEPPRKKIGFITD